MMKKLFLLCFCLLFAVTGCYTVADESNTGAVSSAPYVSVASVTASSVSAASSTPVSSKAVFSQKTQTSSKAKSSSLSTVSAVSTKTVDVVDQKRKAVENKYKVKIYYGDEVYWDFEGMTITTLREPSYVLQALELLNTELARYPDGFFSDFSRQLRIFLITKFTDSYAGLASYEKPECFELYLSTSPDSTQVLHHELMHMIDFTMQEKSGYAGFDNWDSLNPAGFTYSNSDYSTSDYTYGAAGIAADVYFLSNYSTKSELEDRAEIFRYAMSVPTMSSFFKIESPVRIKLAYMSSEIRRVFPSVQKVTKTAWEQIL